ncbi:DUF551 domain-containing protein [Escherichia coli]|nr:hypothetical protein GJ11_09415 [Escherichia coli]EKA1090823.1 DUF551 domain-containing protein [Escherichia coli]ELB9148344.1 DUF551 domain-containing protein [Escherichia coli]ELC3408859.1 DUF551 domain-containing protein [Escherichia coli]ELW6976614.1 DUF551 domain-containing protein [Escherichia coli]
MEAQRKAGASVHFIFMDKSYGWTECDTFERYYDWSRNKWWAVTDDGEESASKLTHWMPLPEPPQESKSE